MATLKTKKSNLDITKYIKTHLSLSERSIKNTVELLMNDATIPFIARYRKEMTGNLDEVSIEQISGLVKTFQELEKRKKTILASIEEQGKLTQDLKVKIESTYDPGKLEDLYLPYKKKRKTKADAAIEAGLEPLAKILMAQRENQIEVVARRYRNQMAGTIEDVLEGAKHIVAEWINEDQIVREKVRQIYRRKASISAKVVKTEEKKPSSQKFSQYFEWKENLNRIPSHRFLAIHRAEKEGVLRIKVEVDKGEVLDQISGILVKKGSSTKKYLEEAIEDAYKRLLKPSFQTEFMGIAKKKADEEAIRVF